MKLFFVFGILFSSGNAIASSDKIYQMDLFSIISFGLAVAAFALSIFMAWLSWKFYEKSAQDSKDTQASVVKIETAVLGIQSNITEIVRQAVGQWTSGTNNSSHEYNEKFEELSELIKNSSDSSEVQSGVRELINLIQEQNKSYLAEARAKAIFPSINVSDEILSRQISPVSQFSQEILLNTEQEKSGRLIIDILRDSKIATITGKFHPAFKNIPEEFSAKLVSAPMEDFNDIVLTYGVGKVFDFNIHLKSRSGNLPLGSYIIEYKAKNNN